MSKYLPGQRVRVTQQQPRQSGDMVTTVEGTVLRFGQQKTGSWYAHSKDHKLWLDRLELRKDDGELVALNLDQYSSVEILADAPASSAKS
ncbi:MAG: hypothetical protein SFY96_12675 [Planctomycetota bacterium]|nr:hypothetical protein [Planctomycetota bacterium]